jgi:Tfp pilus assembly protein PilF
MLQNDTTGAMKQFEIYTKDNPDDPAGYDQMLRIILQKENMDRVREITTEALKHLPQEPQFYFYLGASYYQQKNYKEALRVFEEGLKQAVISNPLLESDFHGQIGDLNYFLGNKETAFQSYEKALKLNPQNLSVLNNYSYYLSLEKKDLDKAEQMSGITIKAEPMNPTFLDTYGWVLYEQGSYFMAKIYIEKAIEYSKENPSADVLEHYGDILYRTGDKEKALEQWKKARELESDSDTLDRKIETGTL